MAQPRLINVKGSMLFPNIPHLAFTAGDIWHVKPSSGNDGNTGKRPDQAFKTLATALSAATANQNDVVLLYGEGNSSALCTDYQSATLDWNKDMVHLIGVSSPSPMSNRSRVAFTSAYNTASNLFTLSANGCIIAGMAFFAGVAGTSPTGCVQQTGDRNYWFNCHLAGIGNDNNDIANAYSLYLNGVEETTFENCRIGLNTVSAGTAANSEITLANTVKNVFWKDCTIYRRIEHQTNHPLVRVSAATSLDEMVLFERCKFISTSTNYATYNAGVFKLTADFTQGLIFLDRCFGYNGTTAGKWDVDDRDKIIIVGSPTPAADSCSLGRAV